uniref:Ubiquitin-associated domain-containing protein 1 n=1 Tax=Cacopsylla melanoneura TaxID=428564 RepID=A0A8D8WSI9_9HEMI
MFPWVRTKLSAINLLFKTNKTTCKDSTMQIKLAEQNNGIKLNIISEEGSVWILDVSQTILVSELISMALYHFYNISDLNDPLAVAQSYKLVSVGRKSPLSPNTVLEECDLKSYDELLLVEKNKSTPVSPSTSKSTKSPSKRQIIEATRCIESKHTKSLIPPHQEFNDNDIDMRKVFISLIEVSSKILSAREDADTIYETILEKIQSKLYVTPDKNLMKKFTNMGFSEQQVIIALKLKRNNTTETLEWLLDSNNKYLDYASIVTYLNDSDNLHKLTTDKSSMLTFHDKIQLIVIDYKRRRLLDFKFDMEVVNHIKEMGFSEKEVKEALRITNNNQISAVSK